RGIATRAILTVAGCPAWAFWTGLRLRSYGCSIHTTEARLVVAQGTASPQCCARSLENAVSRASSLSERGTCVRGSRARVAQLLTVPPCRAQPSFLIASN